MDKARTIKRLSMDRWLRLGRREIGPLAIILLTAGLLLGFGLIAAEVLEGDTGTFDRTILLAFRNPTDPSDPIGPVWIEEMARDITSLGSTTVLALVAVAVIGFLILIRKRAAALLVLIAVSGGTLLSSLLKFGFARPRPELVSHAVQVYTASFPSGHAMLSAVTYLTLGALLTRVQSQRRVKTYLLTLAVMLTLLIGLSRIYLGVHWPTDVLAGWCVGSAWAMLCWLVALWLQQKGEIEPPNHGNGP
ncbi:MAG: phosphatase PAP2 family protein [Candidatus Competibacteraceae bacterium]